VTTAADPSGADETPDDADSPDGTGTPDDADSPNSTGTPDDADSPDSTGSPDGAPSPAGTGTPTSLLAGVREACAAVAAVSTRVAVDTGALDELAATLAAAEPELMPEERPVATDDAMGTDEAMAAQVVAWNAVNFGSGWFPVLRKRDGLSGARSLAEALADHVAASGAPTAEWLSAADAPTCAEVFGQPHPGPVDDLLDLFARAWRDLGALLTDRFDGSAAALVRSAGGSAEALVGTLAAMPLAHDVSRYRTGGADDTGDDEPGDDPGGDDPGDDDTGGETIEVPLYKRAQITVSHLARAFGGEGLGRFDDVDRLTAFADNLVPHVLRMAGVLVYDDDLAGRIGREELLDPGSAEEVEIRACGVHAVELLAERTGLTSAAIDHQLWQRGQDPAIKAVPRHRCRTSWY
jgi:hypothetical protein